MQFQTYSHLKDTKPKLATRAYDAAMTMLRQGHFEARRLISGVRPPILDESGVVAAVVHLVNEQRLQRGPTIELLSEVEFNRLAPILENAVYRIVQEGLANACRHSRSQRVRVELVQHGDYLRIVVRDWGIGFDPAGIEEGRFGLDGIRQRARLLGGQATLQSAPAKAPVLPWTCRWRSRSKGRRVRACTHAVVIVDTDRIACVPFLTLQRSFLSHDSVLPPKNRRAD